MILHNLLRRPAAASVALIAFAATTATAGAADITVTDAAIKAGKLVITGTTAARTRVRLDGQAAHTVTSNAKGKFKFEAAYLPSDCVVTLQSAGGAATDAVVANCARGLSPRGKWRAEASYRANDLVTHEGSTWLATSENADGSPGEGADWQLFAQGGDGSVEAGGEDGVSAAARAVPSGPAGGDLAGNYPNPKIRKGAVTTAKIASKAVTAGKIAAGAINAGKIAANAVITNKIADGAVTTLKIADNAVNSAKVLNESLTALDLGPNSVGSSEVVDDSLTAVDLATNSVGQLEIQTDGVAATEIADNSIDSGEIVDNSLFAADLGAGAVRASELGTITRRSATNAAIPPGGVASASVACLAGERIIAGGNDASLDVDVVASRDNGNGWAVFGRNNAGANRSITVHAYCLNV